MRFFLLLLLALSASNVWAQKNRLDVQPIAPGFWVHTTYGKFKGSSVPSNGLIVEQGGHVWIVDTGWGKKSTRKLLRWVQKKLQKPIDLVIITHSHDDRAGGISVFQQLKIPIFMTSRTAGILQKQKVDTLNYERLDGYAEDAIPAYEGEKNDTSAYTEYSGSYCTDQYCFEWQFPGEGHAPDNIVVFFSEASILFGGCFVKSMEAENLGNLSDANLLRWPKAVHVVMSTFPDAQIVIPGHQAWGGPELLNHTLKLLENAKK